MSEADVTLPGEVQLSMLALLLVLLLAVVVGAVMEREVAVDIR